MRYLIYFIYVLILVNSVSCSKKCPCSPSNIYFHYINFQNSETDTIIIRRYLKGSGFSSLHDTGIIDAINSNYYLHGDTLSVTTNIDSIKIRSDYNYELFLPAVNKLSRINEILEEPKETGCISRNLHGCVNYIYSFKIDGQSVPPNTMYPDYPTVYIRR